MVQIKKLKNIFFLSLIALTAASGFATNSESYGCLPTEAYVYETPQSAEEKALLKNLGELYIELTHTQDFKYKFWTLSLFNEDFNIEESAGIILPKARLNPEAKDNFWNRSAQNRYEKSIKGFYTVEAFEDGRICTHGCQFQVGKHDSNSHRKTMKFLRNGGTLAAELVLPAHSKRQNPIRIPFLCSAEKAL